MSGQPQLPPWFVFDVTNLQVTEPGGLSPAVIVPTNGPFDLSVTFDGTGPIWDFVEALGIQFKVNYYAEGLGYNAPDYDLGTQVVTALAAGGPYTDPVTKLVGAAIPSAGLYQLACTVTTVVPGPIAGHVTILGPSLQVY